MPKPDQERQEQRRLAAAHAPLVEMLDRLYPTSRIPALEATDREIGEWIGQRRLIDRLKKLIEETRDPSAPLLSKAQETR